MNDDLAPFFRDVWNWWADNLGSRLAEFKTFLAYVWNWWADNLGSRLAEFKTFLAYVWNWWADNLGSRLAEFKTFLAYVWNWWADNLGSRLAEFKTFLAYVWNWWADNLGSHLAGFETFLAFVASHWPLALAGTVVWSLWLYRFVASHRAGPIVNAFRTSASVVVPSYHEDPDILLKCLETWRSEQPDEIIVDGQAASQIMFIDPSGRRWQKVRIIGALMTASFVIGILAVVPHLNDIPVLSTTGERLGPPLTAEATGKRVPVVGEGPLVRILEVHRENGQITGVDPSTKQVEATFMSADQKRIGQSGYVIQQFGYPATAEGTISLTFDDGPDLKWTPELLNLLSAEKVPATFFATGTMIARNPEIFQREVREGHAVANHSLTHVDVSNTPEWRTRLELTITDHIIRAVTGKEVGYFRLPYAGNDERSLQGDIEGMLRSQRYGYVVASQDFDSNDWRYDSNQLNGEMPLPQLTGQNITVLLHDGGGRNRQVTIDYVRRLIAYGKSEGYTFTTMPQVQPWLAERVFDVKPTIWDKLTLNLVQIWLVWPSVLLHMLFVIAVTFVLVIPLINCVIAAIRRRRRAAMVWSSANEERVPVSVLMAAYNEERVIDRTIHSVLASTYPIAEVIVVNDGSSDDTAEKVLEIARQDSRVKLVDQQNTGKAGALNAGLDKVSSEIVVTLDADTILIPETIDRLVRHFAVDKSGRLGAVGGVVRVGNRRRNLLTRWQALEYVTQVGIERAAQDVMGAITIVPGACAGWRKAAIQGVGGYTNVTLAEDCDLSLSFHRAGWRLTQEDEAIAFTEVPENVNALLNQRTRWTFGTLQAIWKHKDLLFRHGLLGWYVLPQYAVTIILPIVFMPFIVFMGIRTAQVQGIHVLLYYFLLFMCAHLIIAAIGIGLLRENWRHLLILPVYRIVIEPLRAYLLYTAIYMAVRGVSAGWNKAARTGRLDASLITVSQPEQEAVAIAGATE